MLVWFHLLQKDSSIENVYLIALLCLIFVSFFLKIEQLEINRKKIKTNQKEDGEVTLFVLLLVCICVCDVCEMEQIFTPTLYSVRIGLPIQFFFVWEIRIERDTESG